MENKTSKKKWIIAAICIILVIFFVSIFPGKTRYTENMKKVREDYNPWYLETKLNGGDLLDSALKNEKWSEENNTVIVKGKDKKTGDSIVITYKIDDRGKVTFESMTRNGEEKDMGNWYKYLTNYIK